MIPFIMPIALGCMGVFDLVMPRAIDKKSLKKYKECLRQYEDTIKNVDCCIRNAGEMLEAAKKDFNMCEGYSEVAIVSKKQNIRNLEEDIETLKQDKQKCEEYKKFCEEQVARLETKLY